MNESTYVSELKREVQLRTKYAPVLELGARTTKILKDILLVRINKRYKVV